MVDSLSEASAPGVGLVANQHLKQQQLEVGPSMEEKLHEQELQASRPASPVSPRVATPPVSVAAIAAAAEVAAAFAAEAIAAVVVVAFADVAPAAAAEEAAVVSSSLAVVAAA